MGFKLVGSIQNIEPIASGDSVRVRKRLRQLYGGQRWRKLKGFATVQLSDGSCRRAVVLRYESHGVGRHEFKIKRFL